MTGPGAGRRPTRQLAALLAAAAVPLVLLPGVVAPSASAAEPCVGVIVDARLLGGEVSTGCAKGDPDSGLEALATAGFGYAFAPRVPGFVCQIDAAPECSRTGTTTYWSYWYLTKGSRAWVYSSTGAGSHDPAPGSTEAWVWQDGGRREPPDVALETICPQVATARTERTERTEPSSSPSPARTSRSAAAARPSGRMTNKPRPATSAASSSASAAPTRTAGTDTADTTTPPAPAPSTARPAGSSRADGAVDGAGGGPDGTPWAGVVLGGGLVAALGAAALARARRTGGSP